MRLVADSACDIKELEGMVFKAVPLTISTDNEEFCDDEQLDIHREQCIWRNIHRLRSE